VYDVTSQKVVFLSISVGQGKSHTIKLVTRTVCERWSYYWTCFHWQVYWQNGKICCQLPGLEQIREKVRSSLESLRNDHKRNLNPTPYKVFYKKCTAC